MKPFSQAAENNKGPILDVLRDYLTAPGDLLEIGAGKEAHRAIARTVKKPPPINSNSATSSDALAIH